MALFGDLTPQAVCHETRGLATLVFAKNPVHSYPEIRSLSKNHLLPALFCLRITGCFTLLRLLLSALHQRVNAMPSMMYIGSHLFCHRTILRMYQGRCRAADSGHARGAASPPVPPELAQLSLLLMQLPVVRLWLCVMNA